MKITEVTSWLDRTLDVAAFDDVSNNGLQIERSAGRGAVPDVKTVAVAVDASVRSVEAAGRAGAQLLVVHHGISWGGGIRRLTGGVCHVVRAALAADLALYACHLPLDAHPKLGNNAQLAKLLGLSCVKPAFSYRGNVIGVTGRLATDRRVRSADATIRSIRESIVSLCRKPAVSVGICSGGAGEFAEEAKRLGCDVYVTGEASWGDVIAAENCGMPMICAGHCETEVYGVRAVAKALRAALGLRVVDLT